MKDATGELSMTAIAVVAIAAIGLLFTTLVWPTIKVNIMRSTYCSSAFDCDCTGSTNSMCKCKYCDTGNLGTNVTSGGTNAMIKCDSPQEIMCSKNNN